VVGKKNNQYSTYNLKYTIGVQIGTGEICAVYGPNPGSMHDITAIRETDWIAVITAYDPLEILLADKGYQGLNHCLTSFKSRNLTPDQEAFNEVLANVRQIESLFGLKQIGACSDFLFYFRN